MKIFIEKVLDIQKEIGYIKIVKAKDLLNGARCGNCKTGVYKRKIRRL